MKFDRPNEFEIERLQKTFTLSSNEFKDNISLQELLLHFQELAGKQVDLIGVGNEYIEKTKHIYVLCREKIVFLKDIVINKKYTLVTYPLTPSKLQMQREAYLLDENDEVCLKLDSVWVLIDYVSRRMVRTTDVINAQSKYPKFETFEPVFESKLEQIEKINIDGLEPILVHEVDKDDLDSNNHMNNTVYLKLFQKFINDQIIELEIDYEKECLLGETLKVYEVEEQNTISFIGIKEDGLTSFRAKCLTRQKN